VTAYALIRQAILAKKIIRAIYQKKVRVMCPHVLGKKNGRERALFYQFAGASSQSLGPVGDSKNWRCLFVDQLSNVSIEDGDWHSAPNDSRPQECVDQIDVQYH
jgi:hypothetical protein